MALFALRLQCSRERDTGKNMSKLLINGCADHLMRLAACAILSASIISTGRAQTVPYVEHGTPDQVMDVYWPKTKPTATILFVHGGSLQESGERRTSDAYKNVCTQFVAHDIACATMDYRLAPTNKWPTMPNDVASAVLALRKVLATGKGDPSKIFLFGHSSGCHLVAIVGTDSTYLHKVGLHSSDIAGIIPMGCILDRNDATVRGLTADKIRAPFMREAEDVATFGTPETYLSANPASFIGKHVPPTLIILADAERFMPPVMEQGSRFVRMLLENNVPANLVVVPGKHMSSIAAVSTPGDPTLAAILKFIADPRGSAAAH